MKFWMMWMPWAVAVCWIMSISEVVAATVEYPNLHKLVPHGRQKQKIKLQGATLSSFLDELEYISFDPTNVLDISKPVQTAFDSYTARRAIIESPVDTKLFHLVDDYFFTVNISVGTPPQEFEVVIDTTSSDIVIPNSTFRTCVQKSEGQCALGNIFYANESSTFQPLNVTYNFTRLNDVFLSGEYFKDNVNIGGFTLNNTQMALANDSSGATLGILGLGSSVAEGVANSSEQYKDLLALLLQNQTIYERVYSLWQQTNTTNNATTGNLLIGGVDTSQYIDPLYVLPMVPMDNKAQPYEFGFVSLTGISVSSQNVSQNLTAPSYQVPVLLDSSNAISYLPYQETVAIASQLSAYYVESIAGWIQTCGFRDLPGTVNFQFYNANIRVPISNLLLDMYDNNGDPIIFNNGEPVCVLALTSADTEGYSSLGVGILSAMYTVFDFDDNQIAIAELNPEGLSVPPNITVLANNISELTGVSVLNPVQQQVSVGSPTASIGLAEGNLLPYYVVPTNFENNGFTASLPSLATAVPDLFSQSVAPPGTSSTNSFIKSEASTVSLSLAIVLFITASTVLLFS
jgi:yapsin 1